MTDTEGTTPLAEDDPVGAMRLLTTVRFGQRAAALSGAIPARRESDGGPFTGPNGFTWWPDHPTCTSITKHQ